MRALHSLPFSFVLLSLALPAQKAEASLEWMKRTAKIAYESLPIGSHSLEKLKVGAPWRLGATHDSATWQPTMPILVGDACIAPGAYRAQFLRQEETKCVLVADGCLAALGASGPVHVPGELGKPAKPAKRLSIEIAKKGAAAAGNQPAQIVVQFGNDEWRGEALLVGNKTVSLPGGKLAVFSLPKDQVEKGAVPIATWSPGKDLADSWNVVLEGDTVRLVPWMQAPKTLEDQVVAPDAGKVIQGTVTRNAVTPSEGKAEPAPAKEVEALELREATLVKGELRLVVAYGTKVVECKLPEPKKGK